MRETRPGDGFLGEEVGERLGTTGRRWIVDGIDGTRFFAVGMTEWGSLVALEVDGAIVLGLASSPAQSRRWWPTRGGGAFSRRSGDRSSDTRIHVSTRRQLRPDGVATLPAHDALAPPVQQLVERLAGGPPVARPWHHAIWVAEGRLDVSVWWCGDIWDHAAPSILVEEAGGRFSDHDDGRRLDTRTAVYSNGVCHGDVVAAPGCLLTFTAGSGPVAGSGRHQRNVTGHRHGSEVPQVARLANSAAAASEKNGHSERAPRPVPPGQSVQNSS